MPDIQVVGSSVYVVSMILLYIHTELKLLDLQNNNTFREGNLLSFHLK